MMLNLASCGLLKDLVKKSDAEPKTAVAEKPFVPETAKDLWDHINSVMDELDSYSKRRSMTVSFIPPAISTR